MTIIGRGILVLRNHGARNVVRYAYLVALARLLLIRNRLWRGGITGMCPVDVSITSYGSRLSSAAISIESIARGSSRPRRIVLWLDHSFEHKEFPPALRRLINRGLEVGFVDDIGVHTKYYPYVQSNEPYPVPMVLADDDTIYRRGWLDGLFRSYTPGTATVLCQRAWRVVVDGDSLAPYDTWQLCADTRPSFRNLATGVGGVLYPPEALRRIGSAGEAFRTVCPTNDDIWLHSVMVDAGIRTQQVVRTPPKERTVPGSQITALSHENVLAGQNDVQVRNAYNLGHILRIRTDA